MVEKLTGSYDARLDNMRAELAADAARRQEGDARVQVSAHRAEDMGRQQQNGLPSRTGKGPAEE